MKRVSSHIYMLEFPGRQLQDNECGIHLIILFVRKMPNQNYLALGYLVCRRYEQKKFV